jgi:DNA-binding MarR family transcriptional regulator
MFSLDDMSRFCFAVSPVWELVASLRLLGRRDSSQARAHAPWIDAAVDTLRTAGFDLRRLRALAPPSGHVADFLTPSPHRRTASFETELDRIAATPPDAVRLDVSMLRSQQGADSGLLTDAEVDPAAFLAGVLADLRAYWDLAIAPHWGRLRSLAEADISWRLEQIADRGPRGALATLHPRVEVQDQHLVVHTTCTVPKPVVPPSGIVLVPCALAWPDTFLLDDAAQVATLAYAPRGIARLWHGTNDENSALADLLGRTRAVVLALLDLPTTNAQLAAHLELTPPTTNEHLHVLHRAGMVSRTRRGRSVLYARTPLGDQLIANTGPVRTDPPT